MVLLSFRDHDFYYNRLWEELMLLTFVHCFGLLWEYYQQFSMSSYTV